MRVTAGAAELKNVLAEITLQNKTYRTGFLFRIILNAALVEGLKYA